MQIFQVFFFFWVLAYISSAWRRYAAPKPPNHPPHGFLRKTSKNKQAKPSNVLKFCRSITIFSKSLPLYEVFNHISCSINCHGNCDCCCSDISSGQSSSSDREMQTQAVFHCLVFLFCYVFLAEIYHMAQRCLRLAEISMLQPPAVRDLACCYHGYC